MVESLAITTRRAPLPALAIAAGLGALLVVTLRKPNR